jgi:hypothetical protein
MRLILFTPAILLLAGLSQPSLAGNKDVVLSCDFEDADWWRAWGWYAIEMYCKLNSLGKDGEPGKKDGVLKAWIDGQSAYERTDLRFRDVAKLKIETVWVNVYHGGTKPAPDDLHLYLDNLVISHKPVGQASSLP